MFPSMDEALHYFSADEKCLKVGKAAIVNSIIGAEAECRLNFEGRLGRPDLAKAHDALPEFLSMPASGVTKEEMPHIFRNIIFINFNYDRVLEHYFFWALQQYAFFHPSRPQTLSTACRSLDRMEPWASIGAVTAAVSSLAVRAVSMKAFSKLQEKFALLQSKARSAFESGLRQQSTVEGSS